MDLSDFQFVPLAHDGLYWPSQKTLFVADLHLGKEASFCREGIAVPRGASERTLQRISKMLAETEAERLVILGDLFHARSSLAEDVRALFASFLESVSPVSVTLVLGNHDRAVGALPNEWPMKIVNAWSMNGISLSHFPSLPIGEDSLAHCRAPASRNQAAWACRERRKARVLSLRLGVAVPHAASRRRVHGHSIGSSRGGRSSLDQRWQ
jgi:hypothetical protein